MNETEPEPENASGPLTMHVKLMLTPSIPHNKIPCKTLQGIPIKNPLRLALLPHRLHTTIAKVQGEPNEIIPWSRLLLLKRYQRPGHRTSSAHGSSMTRSIGYWLNHTRWPLCLPK